MNYGFFRRAIIISLTRFAALSLALADMIMLGHQSNYAVHAYTVASQIIQIFVILSVALSIGINIVIGRSRKDRGEKIRNTVQYSCFLSCILFASSLLGTFLVLADRSATASYLILSISILPLCLYVGFSSILETVGLEKKVLYVTLLASALNITLNYWLIYSIVDSALAVSISTLLVRTIALLAAIILMKYSGLSIKPLYSKPVSWNLFQLGRPEALMSILFTGGISLLVLQVSRVYSVDSTAFFGISLNFMNTFSVVFVGIAVSLAIVLSQERQNLKGSLNLIKPSIIYITAVSIILIYCSSFMTIVYTGSINADLALYLNLSVFVIAFHGIAGVFISALRVNGHSQIPPFFMLTLIFVGIPMSFIIEIYSDPLANIIIFMAIGNLLSVMLCLIYFIRVCVTPQKKMEQL